MSNSLQKIVDLFWERVLFKFLPQYVTPMTFTFIRLFLVPVILLLIALQSYFFALIFFVVASLSDTVDGSLARTRNQVSFDGKLLDGLSDKLLIILTMLFFFYFYPYWMMLFAVLLLDFMMALGGIIFVLVFRKKFVPITHWTAKIKMTLEVISVLIIFIYLIFGVSYLADVALFILVLTFIFGLVSLLNYEYQVFSKM